MRGGRNQPVIRRFEPGDGPACHAMRREAFLKVFSAELEGDAIEAGADAFDVTGFGQLLGSTDSFVAIEEGERVGFCTIRYPHPETAEILYVYVDLARVGRGIGKRLVGHAERWITEKHPEVTSIILDTAVPKYNRAFYEKLGYQELGPTVCRYPTGAVAAVRLVKRLRR